MRTEKDFIGEVSIPKGALYGVHSVRARDNFDNQVAFPVEWFQATGSVKLACYRTVRKLLKALKKEHPEMIDHLSIPDEQTLGAMEAVATAITSGDFFEYFIVPGTQGGAGCAQNIGYQRAAAEVESIF